MTVQVIFNQCRYCNNTYAKIQKFISMYKYYQKNKERLHKKLVKDIKAFVKKKRKKSILCHRYKNLSEE